MFLDCMALIDASVWNHNAELPVFIVEIRRKNVFLISSWLTVANSTPTNGKPYFKTSQLFTRTQPWTLGGNKFHASNADYMGTCLGFWHICLWIILLIISRVCDHRNSLVSTFKSRSYTVSGTFNLRSFIYGATFMVKCFCSIPNRTGFNFSGSWVIVPVLLFNSLVHLLQFDAIWTAAPIEKITKN